MLEQQRALEKAMEAKEKTFRAELEAARVATQAVETKLRSSILLLEAQLSAAQRELEMAQTSNEADRIRLRRELTSVEAQIQQLQDEASAQLLASSAQEQLLRGELQVHQELSQQACKAEELLQAENARLAQHKQVAIRRFLSSFVSVSTKPFFLEWRRSVTFDRARRAFALRIHRMHRARSILRNAVSGWWALLVSSKREDTLLHRLACRLISLRHAVAISTWQARTRRVKVIRAGCQRWLTAVTRSLVHRSFFSWRLVATTERHERSIQSIVKERLAAAETDFMLRKIAEIERQKDSKLHVTMDEALQKKSEVALLHKQLLAQAKELDEAASWVSSVVDERSKLRSELDSIVAKYNKLCHGFDAQVSAQVQDAVNQTVSLYETRVARATKIEAELHRKIAVIESALLDGPHFKKPVRAASPSPAEFVAADIDEISSALVVEKAKSMALERRVRELALERDALSQRLERVFSHLGNQLQTVKNGPMAFS
jgi:hypothetical protein